MLFGHHVHIGTGYIFAGQIVRNVRANTHFSVVPRLRASVALTAMECTGDL